VDANSPIVTQSLSIHSLQDFTMSFGFRPQAKRALADRLSELRRERKWSQEQLAEEAGMHRMHRTYLSGISDAGLSWLSI
jgi:ribosomal protein S12 methylthiotransferase accessory factor YcaO